MGNSCFPTIGDPPRLGHFRTSFGSHRTGYCAMLQTYSTRENFSLAEEKWERLNQFQQNQKSYGLSRFFIPDF